MIHKSTEPAWEVQRLHKMQHFCCRGQLGAIGAGFDLANGRTQRAIWRNSIVTQHPDTLAEVGGLPIPHFNRMLEIAAGCNAMTGLGYVGVDPVLDRDKGQLMLELNARPGVNIQTANRAGLSDRLEVVDRNDAGNLPGAERIAFAKDMRGVGGKLGVPCVTD